METIFTPLTAMFRPTPSRGGRRDDSQRWMQSFWVSTHALARRATGQHRGARHGCTFRPTPSRGGRRRHSVRRSPPGWFRPTPSRGGRLMTSSASLAFRAFRPTPSRGGRQPSHADNSSAKPFRPTPSRGGRPAQWWAAASIGQFRPTPSRGGRRRKWQCRHACRDVSTHALARRATIQARILTQLWEFRPTPSHGGRRFPPPSFRPPARCFDPRPRAEGDRRSNTGWPVLVGFDPRPRAEGDPSRGPIRFRYPMFRPTPSRGGRPR